MPRDPSNKNNCPLPSLPSLPHRPTYFELKTPLIVTGEAQPFHLNPEKVELQEHDEQRRGMESTQNTSETAPLCELGPRPAATPPQPHPGAGVPGEAGRAARTDRGLEGVPGARGRGQGRGAELQAAGFVQSGPGVPTGVPRRPVRGGAPQTCAWPRGGPERSEGGRASPRRDRRVGRVGVPAGCHHPRPPAAPSPQPRGRLPGHSPS